MLTTNNDFYITLDWLIQYAAFEDKFFLFLIIFFEKLYKTGEWTKDSPWDICVP